MGVSCFRESLIGFVGYEMVLFSKTVNENVVFADIDMNRAHIDHSYSRGVQ
tara:strand:- start:88 stop:240 length:153 start_codon:yes stop_codon:yes gene_type:complete